MTKIKIKIVVAPKTKIKALKRLSRAAAGRPRVGQKILPKKGGPYQRRVKHRRSLSAD